MKNTICLITVVLMFLFAGTIPGYTADGGGRHGGDHYGGGGDHRGGGDWHGGGDHHGGGDWHHGDHGGSNWYGSVWIGPGWGWGPWWGSPYYSYYPYYPYYPYNPYNPYYPYYSPYYSEPPVTIQKESPTYAQPAPQPEQQYYWYFCQNPEGYYPYIKKCPGGWLKVVPPTPPDEKE